MLGSRWLYSQRIEVQPWSYRFRDLSSTKSRWHEVLLPSSRSTILSLDITMLAKELRENLSGGKFVARSPEARVSGLECRSFVVTHWWGDFYRPSVICAPKDRLREAASPCAFLTNNFDIGGASGARCATY
jgi:hypothetical protein